MAEKSTNKYDELDQGTPFGMAGEAMEMAKSKYDKLDHPEAEEIKPQPPYVPDIATGEMGALVGGGASAVGAGGRMLYGTVANDLAQKIAEANKANANPVAASTESQRPTSGGRYSEKTDYGRGEGTVEEVVNRYKRMAAAKNSIMSFLEKKFGVKDVGESSDILQRLIDKKNANAAGAEQQAREMAFWESPTGQALRASMEVGKPVLNYLGEVGRGAIQGANIAGQMNEGFRAYNEGNDKTAAAHALAGGLSLADLATVLAPSVSATGLPMKAALRSITGPGSMIASTVAEGAEDVNKGNYGALPVDAMMGAAPFLGGPIGMAGFGTIYGMKHLAHPVAPEEYEKSPLDYGASQGIMGP
jgi:hypothetical protein